MKDNVDDNDEDEEVGTELLAGLFDESTAEQDTCNETLDLSGILMNFYGSYGSGQNSLST
jgi:hypothetical protein